MGTLFYLFLIFLFIKFVQYIIKKAKEQNQTQNYDTPKQTFPQQQVEIPSFNYSPEQGYERYESSLGFYSFNINDEKEEFYFTVRDNKYTFAFRELLGYEIKTRNDAVITMVLKTTRPDMPFLEIECFSKIKAVELLPEEERRPLPLHRLYEKELEQVEEIGDILEDVLEDNEDYAAEYQEMDETPPPVPVVVLEEPEHRKEEVVEEIPNLFDIIEPVETDKVNENTEPESIGQSYDEENIQVDNEPIVAQQVEEDQEGLIRISLSDVEYYSYGKFLDSEVQSAVGDAKMRGKKEIFITKEQLEKLKQ